MRITHNMLSRNYLNSVNNNLKNLSGSNDKLASQRSFNKASEDVSGADKALRVRRLLNDNERAIATMEDLNARYESAENSVRAVNDLVSTITDDLTRGMTGTMSSEDREKLAREIENLQDHVFQSMNSKFSDKYLFAAAGNDTGAAPFSKDTSGALLYNGQPVDDMEVGADGQPSLNGDPIKFNKKNFVDVGLGFVVNGDGTDGVVDSRTGMPSTFSGVEVFGFGKDNNGNSKNMYSLLGQVADGLRSGDPEKMGTQLDAIKEAHSNLLLELTDIGNLYNFNDQNIERFTSDNLSLKTTQNKVEAVPLEKEIMSNKDFEMSWMITLQLGSKILPQSIFNFLG